MAATTLNTRDLLTSVHDRLAGLRKARDVYARRLAPEFNALALLRPDELRLSSLLAELLDPAGRHAQGRKFWDLFAAHFELPAWAQQPKEMRIRTEIQTDGADWAERRIDVLVELDSKSAVAIENKPWAADQKRQVADYLTHLDTRYPSEHLLIYLSGSGRYPDASSISEVESKAAVSKGRLLVVGFDQLIPWLTLCRSDCEAPTVAAFLAEFESYIRAEFLGIRDMLENELIVEEATRNSATVEAAFEIVKAGIAIKEKLLRDLVAQIQEILKETGRPWSFSAQTTYTAVYQGFSFQLAPEDRYTVRFQFEQGECRQFFWGVTKQAADPHLEDVRQALDRELNCKSGSSNAWTWFRDFDAPLWDWRDSAVPWQRIVSGEMAKTIVDLVERVYRCLEKEKLLPRLGVALPQPGDGDLT